MPAVTLTLNGEIVSARDGEPLLEVIRERGLRLSTLCHVDGLSARGGCRLCLVEIDGVRRPQPACVTPAREGLSVRTHTPRLLAHRRMILELLLAERNHPCAVCTMNRRCELQAAAAENGVDHVRFDCAPGGMAVDATHPRFGRDPNRCILCARCLRGCDEIEKACTIDVMGRGNASRIIFDLNRPWGDSTTCTSCGVCVRLCPTGALFDRGPA